MRKSSKPSSLTDEAVKAGYTACKKCHPGDAVEAGFVGNKDSKVYHKSTCRLVGKIKANNVVKFANQEEGIDFTAHQTPLEVHNGGQAIKFHLEPAMLQQLQNTAGFTPEIINIQPLADLKEFLQVNEENFTKPQPAILPNHLT